MEITAQKIIRLLSSNGLMASKDYSNGRIRGLGSCSNGYKLVKLGNTEYHRKGRGYKTTQTKTYDGRLLIYWQEGSRSDKTSKLMDIANLLDANSIPYKKFDKFTDNDYNSYDTCLIINHL